MCWNPSPTASTWCDRSRARRGSHRLTARLVENTLDGGVRPWDLSAPQRRAATLGPVSSARAVSIDDDVLVAELECTSEDLGQGETESRYRYAWTDGGRSILAEEVKNEIFDGATPYSTYVRGVIIDGDGGVVLTGRGDSAVVTEG